MSSDGPGRVGINLVPTPHCILCDFGNVIAFFDHGKARRQLAHSRPNDPVASMMPAASIDLSVI